MKESIRPIILILPHIYLISDVIVYNIQFLATEPRASLMPVRLESPAL